MAALQERERSRMREQMAEQRAAHQQQQREARGSARAHSVAAVLLPPCMGAEAPVEDMPAQLAVHHAPRPAVEEPAACPEPRPIAGAGLQPHSNQATANAQATAAAAAAAPPCPQAMAAEPAVRAALGPLARWQAASGAFTLDGALLCLPGTAPGDSLGLKVEALRWLRVLVGQWLGAGGCRVIAAGCTHATSGGMGMLLCCRLPRRCSQPSPPSDINCAIAGFFWRRSWAPRPL